MSLYPVLACQVSVAPVRTEPSHRAEQSTQLLFGERVTLLQEEPDGWVRIRAFADDYEGWCRLGQLRLLDSRQPVLKPIAFAGMSGGYLLGREQHFWLPAGSELYRAAKGEAGAFRYRGEKIAVASLCASGSLAVTYARALLNAPYLWGGRTIAGIDCSGLCQLAYKLCGVAILRDASQQAEEGVPIGFLAESKPGDLAFFDNAEGKIVHVGMLSSPHSIVHATDTSGCVVEDRIDSAGIISRRLKKRTHQLRLIRRILES